MMFGRVRRLAIVILVSIVALPIQAQQAGNAGSSQTSSKQSGEPTDATPKQIAPAIDRIADELAKSRAYQNDTYGDEHNEREKRNADAQDKMAYWAEAMFWAVVMQTGVAFFALIFLLLDLRQNRRSAEAQLRAYVSVKMGALNFQKMGLRGYEFSFETIARNGGDTPAYDYVSLGIPMVLTGDEASENLSRIKPIDDDAYKGGSVVHSGEDMTTEMPKKILIPPDLLESIKQGSHSLYIFGVGTYIDTFGKRRRTDWCYFINGDNFREGLDDATANAGTAIITKWIIPPFHNTAT